LILFDRKLRFAIRISTIRDLRLSLGGAARTDGQIQQL
jgi:hypothetical protein